MKEIWKPIKGYKGRYEVSSHGRIRSNGGKRKLKNHIMRPRIQNSGYQVVNLYKNGKRKTYTVHRLVLTHFKGHPGKKMDANHIDGNKQNNHINNLEWVTRKENVKHANLLGLRKDVRRVGAIKNGKLVAKAPFSRKLAEYIKEKDGLTSKVETIARNIRKNMDTGKKYHGYIFIEIKNL